MGILQKRINDESKGDIASYYKKNSMDLLTKYKGSDKIVTSVPVGKMQLGRFYFLQYLDDSNWMKFSPILTVDFRKFEDKIIVYGINMNFIPLEIRSSFFDRYIVDFDDESQLFGIDYEKAYTELLSIGYEYSIVEYNAEQIVGVHWITINFCPQFLYSAHPKVKYDPEKLYQIWLKKIETKAERHKEITESLVTDFYKATDEIKGKYNQLSGHIARIQKSLEKYGNK